MPLTPRELQTLFEELGHDERAIAEQFVERLRMGQLTYGTLDLENDDRDFHAESIQEAIDLAAYLCMAIHRLGAERRSVAISESGGGQGTPGPEKRSTGQHGANGEGSGGNGVTE